jgi:hypothetical protein
VARYWLNWGNDRFFQHAYNQVATLLKPKQMIQQNPSATQMGWQDELLLPVRHHI